MRSTVIGPSGKVFTYVGTVPYTRKRDGTTTTLRKWTTACSREGCTKLIEVFTPGEGTDASIPHYSQFRRMHCDDHKLTPAEALTLGRRTLAHKRSASRLLTALNKTRAKVTDAEVADIRRMAADNFKPKDIMLVYDLAESTIRSIINGTRR